MTSDVKLRKKPPKKEEESKTNGDKTNLTEQKPKGENVPYKYGPMPKFNCQRIFSRSVIIIGVLIYVWYHKSSGKETVLARHGNTYDGRGVHVDCNEEYLKEIKAYTGCVPKKCGRFVSDLIVTEHEADILLWLAKRGMSMAASNGGATVMDLHSGAMSYGDKFVNLYNFAKKDFITPMDLKIYKVVRQNIQKAIASFFGLDVDKLFLTHPTFFSKLTNKDAVNVHDEYWHAHVDRHQYEAFHYTSLLYLNDYGKDFHGGRFVYLDNLETPRHNMTVEPRKGRVSTFTSGEENPHFVERVIEGERFAITISFTCDESKKIDDPALPKNTE